jgi:hypothetical protein
MALEANPPSAHAVSASSNNSRTAHKHLVSRFMRVIEANRIKQNRSPQTENQSSPTPVFPSFIPGDYYQTNVAKTPHPM